MGHSRIAITKMLQLRQGMRRAKFVFGQQAIAVRVNQVLAKVANSLRSHRGRRNVMEQQTPSFAYGLAGYQIVIFCNIFNIQTALPILYHKSITLLIQQSIMKTNSYFNGTQTIQEIVYNPSPTSTLLQFIEYLFEDITLYNNPAMYALVTASHNGFVAVWKLLQLPVCQQFVQRNSNIFVNAEEVCRVVDEGSKKLVHVNYKLRRIQPFVDEIQSKKLVAVYVDRLPKKSTAEICEYFKNIVGVVYRIYHRNGEKWAIIIINSFEPLQQVRESLTMDNHPMVVLTPLETLISYGENKQLNAYLNLVKMYQNKKMYDIESFEDDYVENMNEDYDDYQYKGRLGKYKQNQIGGQVLDFLKFGDRISMNQNEKNYIENYGSEQRNHRAQKAKFEKKIREDIDRILNYDNTPLLLLSNKTPSMQ